MSIAEPRHASVLCANPAGLHRIGYVEWGDPGNPRVLLCVHGLTRTGRDFDTLARVLSADFRVVCPDMAGRGRSQWLPDPSRYAVPQYLADCITLIARLQVDTIDWIGTSMGGLVGMALAALPGNPVRKLVLNDVGPEIDAQGLARIARYVGTGGPFVTRDEGLALLRALSPGFGPHDEAQWASLNAHQLVQRADGGWALHYDPAIAKPLAGLDGTPLPTMWPLWSAITCPTLAMRGAESDLLSQATLARMAAEGPRARTVEVSGVGHAPTLMVSEQMQPIRDFLAAR